VVRFHILHFACRWYRWQRRAIICVQALVRGHLARNRAHDKAELRFAFHFCRCKACAISQDDARAQAPHFFVGPSARRAGGLLLSARFSWVTQRIVNCLLSYGRGSVRISPSSAQSSDTW